MGQPESWPISFAGLFITRMIYKMIESISAMGILRKLSGRVRCHKGWTSQMRR